MQLSQFTNTSDRAIAPAHTEHILVFRPLSAGTPSQLASYAQEGISCYQTPAPVHVYTSPNEPATWVPLLPKNLLCLLCLGQLLSSCVHSSLYLLSSNPSTGAFSFPTLRSLSHLDLSKAAFLRVAAAIVVRVTHRRRRGDPHPRCSNSVSISGRSHRAIP